MKSNVNMLKIGSNIKQIEGFNAFIPNSFPPAGFSCADSNEVVRLIAEANLAIGKLDGITKLLPDIDFFIYMYVKKEAAHSSQIEGTRAKLTDALQAEVERSSDLPEDVDDILHYIRAMNTGLDLLPSLPISGRLIREVHKKLMTDARSSHDPKPGDFRIDQNWIDGTSPFDARFVPPPAHAIGQAVKDLETFLQKEKELPVLIKAGLAHAQFETIHPFRDGNGRVGRLLVTFYLCEQEILEQPVLYLSEFLKRHRKTYFERLDRYRDGAVYEWLEFFLKGVIEVAREAIDVSDKIVTLREKDIQKVTALSKKTSIGGMLLLRELYKSPIVNARRVQEITGFSRQGAYNLIDRFVGEHILFSRDGKEYGQTYVYRDYLKLFEKEHQQ